MERISTDPEAVEAFAELDEIGVVLAELGGQDGRDGRDGRDGQKVGNRDSAKAEQEALQTTSLPASPVSPVSSPKPSLKALRAAAQSARSAEDKAKVRALAEQAAQDALNSVSTRTFPTAQEARAAGNALQVALRFRIVSEKLEVIAWRCNAFSCEHPMPGGMAQCSDPSRGGVPITRVITEVNEGNAEFSV